MTSERPSLTPVAEARRLMLADARPVDTESIPVADAAGRVLAQAAVARVTQPPFAASAMDGYALRYADLAALPTRLSVIGEAPAGAPFQGEVGAGQAVRIFTGGMLPAGADTVVIQEDTARDGGTVEVREAPAEGAHIRNAGIDFKDGDTLLEAGTRLDGLALALIAAGNNAHVTVYRRPRLAIMATGDELVTPGSELAPGQVVNSIAPGLAALATDWGMEVIHVGHATDSEAAIQAELVQLLKADVAVLIGGASVGDYDLVKPALMAKGLKMDFSKTALKPGKPVWSGHIGGVRLIGLPGNPVSAFVCAHLFLKPALYALTGRNADDAVAMLAAVLDAPLPGNGGREAFVNARARAEGGRIVVTPVRRQDSGLLSPLGRANCLINREVGASPAASGDSVSILPTRADFLSPRNGG